ncbi:MAG: hypothetical protein K1X68_00775 [Saprospiraceae bacterium]|nr:hypothetical protein [Saprospiraceae bacterium]HMW40599.1 hypothetical protein [Saprospiraceae bacterium]HMX89019.1 hypothetical protein [Saprospiraceae bacterium]HMZ40085.1 hypothetical protein [Saprospiraceae bacterium]HNA65398.1 hypothetical protein [Saprospiraceae bacterium]
MWIYIPECTIRFCWHKNTWLALIVCLVFNVFTSRSQTIWLFHDVQQTTGQQAIILPKDSAARSAWFAQHIAKQVSEGFFLSDVDSSVRRGDTLITYGRPYRKFFGLRLLTDSSFELPANWRKLQNVSPLQWIELQEFVIARAIQNGYPLAKIRLLPDTMCGDTLQARLQYDSGPRFIFGETDQRNLIVVNNQYLMQLVNLRPGAAFDQRIYQRIPVVLRQLPYLEMQYAPRLNFFGDRATVYLYLKKKPANSFDLLLGFNQRNDGYSRSVRITGQAGVDLYNSFRWGERLYLHYENLQESSPTLNVLADFPFIKLLPFGIRFNFDLNKYGNDYINFQTSLRLRRQIGFREEISVLLFNNNSYILQPDTAYANISGRLPSSLDFRHLSYGLAYQKNTLNDLFNPTQGLQLDVQLTAGNKKYLEDPTILRRDDKGQLKAQYDSLNRSGLQANGLLKGSYYWLFAQRQVMAFRGQAFGIYSRGRVLQNELIRIGGIKTLRGFNDNSFASDGYFIGTFEYRFLLDRSSYLALFVDHAYMKIISNNTYLPWSHYTGMGAGMQFRTKAGAFGLFFAVSRSKGNSFDFSKPRVHFGYTAFF